MATIDHITQYRSSLMRLMPTGFAWPKHKGTVQYAWIDAWASEFNYFENHAYNTFNQCLPDQTCNRLDEWLKATGLPDECFSGAKRSELRLQMLGRLRGLSGLKYADSSPASPSFIRHLCAEIGYDVEAWYNTPFRVGRNRVGDRLGALDGVLNIRINRVCTPFRVGVNRVGDRLVNCTQDSLDLICYLKRIIPARYSIRLFF